ncbi:hypothetical protein FKM82_027352 [Ascaphus truei]
MAAFHANVNYSSLLDDLGNNICDKYPSLCHHLSLSCICRNGTTYPYVIKRPNAGGGCKLFQTTNHWSLQHDQIRHGNARQMTGMVNNDT